MAVRRSSRHFWDSDKRGLIRAIGACRDACIRAISVAPIDSDVYRKTSALIDSMDDVAEVLTGDRKYFYSEQRRKDEAQEQPDVPQYRPPKPGSLAP